MAGLGGARTQEDTCDLLRAEKTSVGNGREESSSRAPLLGYMDEQVPVQGTELWRASALGVGG